jgi:putative ABC transport system permease protein
MFRLAARHVVRSRWFSAYVVAFVTLCVAAYTALVTITRDVFDHPVNGVRQPDEIRRISAVGRHEPFSVSQFAFSLSEYELIKAVGAAGPTQVAAYGAFDIVLSVEDGGPETVRAAAISPGFFATLGVQPVFGTMAMASGDADIGIVVSARLARHLFGELRGAVGQAVLLNGRPHIVRGVTRDFRGLDDEPTDIFLNLQGIDGLGAGSGWIHSSTSVWLRLISRITTGSSLTTATAQLAQMLEKQAVAFDPHSLLLQPLNLAYSSEGGNGVSIILVAGAMGVCLLLLLFANVSQLLLLRVARRSHELVMHGVLGATTTSMFSLVLLETALPLASGASLGTLIGSYGAAAVVRSAIGLEIGGASSGRTISLIAITVGIGIVVVSIPSSAIATTRSQRIVIESSRVGSRMLMRAADSLLCLQLALATGVLLMTCLFGLNVRRIAAIHYGFDVDGLYLIRSVFQLEGGNEPIVSQAKALVRDQPSVVAASTTDAIPLQSSAWTDIYARADGGSGTPTLAVEMHRVERGYFATLRLNVNWSTRDAEAIWASDAVVAVLSRSTYRALARALGNIPRCLSVGSPDAPCRLIVGMADDANYGGFLAAPQPAVYEPLGPQANRSLGALVRAIGPPETVLRTIREAIRRAGGAQAGLSVEWLRGTIDAQSRVWRGGLSILLLLCALSVLISAVGVATIAGWQVQARRREISIRLAVGAPRAWVAWQILRRVLFVGLLGWAAGFVIATIVAQHYSALLLQSEVESASTVVPATIVVVIGAIAGIIPPVLGILAVSPAEALRHS